MVILGHWVAPFLICIAWDLASVRQVQCREHAGLAGACSRQRSHSVLTADDHRAGTRVWLGCTLASREPEAYIRLPRLYTPLPPSRVLALIL